MDSARRRTSRNGSGSGDELLDAVIDEGTSASKLDPFERPTFIEACERARASDATAIIVECADRFTRQGGKRDGWRCLSDCWN